MTTTALSEVKPPRDGLLYDSQWANIVNHDNAYCGWDVEEAVNHAVKATLAAVKSNIESALASAEPVAWELTCHGTVQQIVRREDVAAERLAYWRTFDPDASCRELVYTHAKPAAKVEAPGRDAGPSFDDVCRTIRAYGLACIDLGMEGMRPSSPTPASVPDGLTADDVQWIVNDNAELGVMIHGKAFFLYKGDSLVYDDAKHDDGTPMYYRTVGKREFGECAHPINHDDYNKIGTVSLDDSDRRQLLPPTTPEPTP